MTTTPEDSSGDSSSQAGTLSELPRAAVKSVSHASEDLLNSACDALDGEVESRAADNLCFAFEAAMAALRQPPEIRTSGVGCKGVAVLCGQGGRTNSCASDTLASLRPGFSLELCEDAGGLADGGSACGLAARSLASATRRACVSGEGGTTCSS
jgi:hypothetical protein